MREQILQMLLPRSERPPLTLSMRLIVAGSAFGVDPHFA